MLDFDSNRYAGQRKSKDTVGIYMEGSKIKPTPSAMRKWWI